MKEFENIINTAWDNKDSINGQSDQIILDAIKETIELVDKGVLRVAEKKDNEWVVHQWIKKAILLSFKTNEMQLLQALTPHGGIRLEEKLRDGEEKNIKKLALEWCLMEQ